MLLKTARVVTVCKYALPLEASCLYSSFISFDTYWPWKENQGQGCHSEKNFINAVYAIF